MGQLRNQLPQHRHRQVFKSPNNSLSLSYSGQLALPSSGQPTTAPTRRRGFGGFAGTVPAPAIIQSLSAVPQLALPAVEQPGASSAGASPTAFVGAEPTSMAPQLGIPKLGAAEPPVVVAGQQVRKFQNNQ